MPRIRTIKPETPRDAKLAKVSRGARLTFIYLWTQADDDGYFAAISRSLLGDLYPHDPDITERILVQELDELRAIGVIQVFDTPDGPLGRVVKFKIHQKIDHPSKSYLATLARTPRETFAKGVLSLGVFSPEQDKDMRHAPISEQPTLDLPPSDGQTLPAKTVLPARRGNQLEAVQDHLRAVDEQARLRLRKAEVRRLMAELVYSYWCAKLQHPTALLDPKRERTLVKALEQNRDNLSELLYVVDGAAADTWANEEIARHDVTVLYRDRTHIEKYLTSAKHKAGVPHPVAVTYLGNGANGDAPHDD